MMVLTFRDVSKFSGVNMANETFPVLRLVSKLSNFKTRKKNGRPVLGNNGLSHV